MSTELRLRRDSNTNLMTTTPAQGEPGYDTTNQRMIVGTGAKLGGMPVPNVLDLQRQTMVGGTVSGTNTLTLTLDTQFHPGVYANLQRFAIKIANTNTGVVTLNVNGLGARNVRKVSGSSKVALVAGDLVAGMIYEVAYDGTDFQLLNVSTVPNGSIDYAHLAADAVHRSTLYALTGSVSRSTVGLGAQRFTAPGGAYGFYPRFYSGNAALSGAFGLSIVSTSTGLTPGTSAVTYITLEVQDANIATQIYAQQTYVSASPPYDIGDGPVPLFVFSLMNSDGTIDATYVAADPPWAYNGPTDIAPNCVVQDQQMRRVLLPRRHAAGDEASKRAMAIAVARGTERLSPLDELVEVFIPVDEAWKNADMDLVPHPFLSVRPGQTVVLLDAQSPVVEKIVEIGSTGGESGSSLIHDWLTIDNNTLRNRAAPPGVAVVGCRWRNTRRT